MVGRRAFVGGALAAMAGAPARLALAATPRDRLPPWTPGTLDIHHIDTGVGNATFMLGPDASTILIDCGATRGGPPASTPLRPNDSRSAGSWVARYALRHAAAANRTTLDCIVATHVHPDHVGSPLPGDPRTPDGVVLTGLSEVDSLMPATLVIDRGFPTYAPLPLIAAPFASNHVAWLTARRAAGKRVEQVAVGSATQLRPRTPGAFAVRFVGGNGRVWTSTGEGSRDLLPPPAQWTVEARPEENHMSVALVLSFGPFRYFAGGDLTADTHDGAVPWLDVETPIVRAAGEVDVASADHHGYFDADAAAFTAALRADTYVVPAWHATHPAMATLQRLLNDWRGRPITDVYITRLSPEARAVNGRFLPRVRSIEGHVVVRVRPDGTFRTLVTDSRDENDTIVFTGPTHRSKRERA